MPLFLKYIEIYTHIDTYIHILAYENVRMSVVQEGKGLSRPVFFFLTVAYKVLVRIASSTKHGLPCCIAWREAPSIHSWCEESSSGFGETSPIFLLQSRHAGVQAAVKDAVVFEAVLSSTPDIHICWEKINYLPIIFWKCSPLNVKSM